MLTQPGDKQLTEEIAKKQYVNEKGMKTERSYFLDYFFLLVLAIIIYLCTYLCV